MNRTRLIALMLSGVLIAGCSSNTEQTKPETKTDTPVQEGKGAQNTDQNKDKTSQSSDASVPAELNAVLSAPNGEDSLQAWDDLLSNSLERWGNDFSLDADTKVYLSESQIKDGNELLEISYDSSFVSADETVYEIDLSERENAEDQFKGGYGILNRYSPDGAVETSVVLSQAFDHTLAGKVQDAQTGSTTAEQAKTARMRLNIYEFGFGRQVSPLTTPDFYEGTVTKTAEGYDLTFTLKEIEKARKMDLGSMPSADAAVPVISFETVEAETLTCHFTKTLELFQIDDIIEHGMISTNPDKPVDIVIDAETDGDEDESDYRLGALEDYFKDAIANKNFEIKNFTD